MLPLSIAIFWWVYIHITSEPDMIMNGVYNKLDMWTWKIPKLNKLLTCEYCLAGFTTMVVYPFVTEYNFFEHLFNVSLAILFVHILNKFLLDEKN
jgi:hypothetical protein